MIVFRITLAKYADQLVASGNAARWNSKDIKVIYTAESRSLACLENVVHRNSRGLQEHFRIITIEIPDSLKVIIVNTSDLMKGWQQFGNILLTRGVGDRWVREGASAVLRVPSVIVPGEHNFILNVEHKDFIKIKHITSEKFEFDGRIKDV